VARSLARATKNRLRIGISLGLHAPRVRQAPALGAAYARYACTIPTALAKITRAVNGTGRRSGTLRDA